MKIYPSKHNIVQVKDIDMNYDIPLAFINTDYSDYKINIVPLNNEFSTKREKAIIPYTTFDSLDIALFYKNRVPVPPEKKANMLIRNNKGYYYMPQKLKSFKPQNFSYTVTYKKKMKYSINKIYNMSVACDDPTAKLTFVNQLMKAFGDAPSRKLCPANLFINNKDVSPLSLVNSTIKENDFIFIMSNDSIHYVNSELATNASAVINFEEFFRNHTNVWLSVNDKEVNFLEANSLEYSITTPTLYPSAKSNTTHCINISTNEDARYVIHKIFGTEIKTPVYIKEDIETGAFLIISHKSFFDKIEKNIEVLYEVMMYVYSNAYLETTPKTEWIADVMPDYVVTNGVAAKRSSFTIDANPSRIFDIENSEAFPKRVTILDGDNIVVENMTQTSISFKKDMSEKYKQYFDPIKKTLGTTSIYTERNEIIFYDEADTVYELSDDILEKATISNVDNNYYITIKSFFNTKAGISIVDEFSEVIPLTKTENYKLTKVQKGTIYICHKNGVLSLIFKESYVVDNGTIIAAIKIDQTQESSKVLDMRQRGGGLPESKEDSYDLLDIGNILGKPYRPGGSLIITLPKRLEPYEELIYKAVKKHMIAEDLPIIIFE